MLSTNSSQSAELTINLSPHFICLLLLFVTCIRSTEMPSNGTNHSTPFAESQWSSESLNEDDDFDHRQRAHNAFKSTRYGLRIDHCPDGGEPELNEQDERIKLCQIDEECKPSYRCQNIVGLTHFGKQIRYCCPTKTSMCTTKPKLDTGIPPKCHRPLMRTFYYFDAEQLKCVTNRMPMCEEFANNQFASEQECRTKCETTACELGESILLHNNSFDNPFVCTDDDECPVGYNCRQDRIFKRSVCCGFLNFEPCPLGFRSFTAPFTGRAKTCQTSATRDECPTDYVCTQNAVSREQFCCTVEKGVCPDGHQCRYHNTTQAYIHPLTDGTIKCNLRNYDPTTSCPPGYVCLAAVFGSSWGFCCSQAVIATCPEDSYPQMNTITSQPQKCELTQEPFICANGFYCETDEVTHVGFCCSIPRKHLKLKPTTEPPPRKRTRPDHHYTTATETHASQPTTTTQTTALAVLTNTSVATTIAGKTDSAKGKGGAGSNHNKRANKGRPEGKGQHTKKPSKERGVDSDGPSSSSSSSSEQTERADLMELSTKLDRFINGMRRKVGLPRGHLRPRPRIWRLKKKKSGTQAELRRVLGEVEEETWRRKKMKGNGENSGPPGVHASESREEEAEEEHPQEEEEQNPQPTQKTLRPKCPHGFRPMAYPGTKWAYLECVLEDGEEHNNNKEEEELRERLRRKGGRKGKNGKRKKGHRQHDDVEEEEYAERNGGEKTPPDESAETEEGEDGEVKAEAEEGKIPARKKSSRSHETCPSPSICLPAKDDLLGRALCCVEKGVLVRARPGEEEQGKEEHEMGGREENEEEEERQKTKRRAGMGGGASAGGKRTKGRGEGMLELGEREGNAPKMEELEEREQQQEEEERRKTDKMSATVAIVLPSEATTALSTLLTERSEDPACPRLIAERYCTPGSTDVCTEEGFFCQFNKERKQYVCCTLMKER